MLTDRIFWFLGGGEKKRSSSSKERGVSVIGTLGWRTSARKKVKGEIDFKEKPEIATLLSILGRLSSLPNYLKEVLDYLRRYGGRWSVRGLLSPGVPSSERRRDSMTEDSRISSSLRKKSGEL